MIRLPLTDGIARVDRSIAMETKKIAVSASGTLDFREEKLDFTLRPRVREGIPLDLPSFAELVHYHRPVHASRGEARRRTVGGNHSEDRRGDLHRRIERAWNLLDRQGR